MGETLQPGNPARYRVRVRLPWTCPTTVDVSDHRRIPSFDRLSSISLSEASFAHGFVFVPNSNWNQEAFLLQMQTNAGLHSNELDTRHKGVVSAQPGIALKAETRANIQFQTFPNHISCINTSNNTHV